jgi:hypothetical protein
MRMPLLSAPLLVVVANSKPPFSSLLDVGKPE